MKLMQQVARDGLAYIKNISFIIAIMLREKYNETTIIFIFLL